MIQGEVNANREAVISLRVRGLEGLEVTIDAVLDTGFTDYLTLPRALVAELQLPFIQTTWTILADGSRVLASVHEGRVFWDGISRTISIHVAEGDSLIGMSLLYGSVVTLEVVDGGEVTIEARS